MRVVLASLALVIGLALPATAQQALPGRNLIYRIDGSASIPSDTYERDRDLGRYRIGADNEGNTAGGTLRWDWNTTRLKLSSGYTLDFNTTSISETDIAKIDGITNGTAAASKALVADSNIDIGTIRNLTATGKVRAASYNGSSDGVVLLVDAAGTSFNRVQFGGTTSSFPALKRSFTVVQSKLADDSAFAGFWAANFVSIDASITSSALTGLTINTGGTIAKQVYKVTADRTAFVCAAVTCDVTIATLPAKTLLKGVFGDLTTVFACTATCTSSTLSMVLGRTAGGATFLVSFDADAAIATFGDADAELGTDLTRATAVQGAYVSSFSGTTTVTVRLTSGTGNIGNGSATNLSTGSITFYLSTERLP